jgi:arginyl-tRNA synthetase
MAAPSGYSPMNVFESLEKVVADALAALVADGALPAGLDFGNVGLEFPRDPTHGDLSTNAAMVLAKPAKMKPRDIADKLAVKLQADPQITKAEIAGPGFINLTLQPTVWQSQITTILGDGTKYGRSDVGQGRRVNVEYVSANPTGPMHVGHTRGAVVGDVTANLLAFAGFDVTREYYINDAGAQVDVLAKSAYLRAKEALGETITIPEGLYPGDYLVPVGQELAKKHGKKLLTMPEAEWLPALRTETIDAMMALIRDDLAALNIKHDVFSSEAALTKNGDKIAETIAWLEARDLVYQGTLPPPKGEPNVDWEDREQTLFRSSKFGDDMDRALKKSNGQYTYFAADLAYHRSKVDRNFDQLINVLGADHSGYAKRIEAAVIALSGNSNTRLHVLFCQMVNLFKDGQPFKMSKRAGTFITLRDVVDEVGRDAVRFMMLYRKNEMPLDFDFAKVTEKSKENPVFYVQYAHARAGSVFRNVTDAFPDLGPDSARLADLASLDHPAEIDLVKQLALFPKLVASAAKAHEPHRLAFYLHDVASAFHQLWARGNDLPHLRFIQSDNKAATNARLALIAATQQVIASGLGVLGVAAPTEMR